MNEGRPQVILSKAFVETEVGKLPVFADCKVGTPQEGSTFVGTASDVSEVVDGEHSFIWLGYNTPAHAPDGVTWIVPEDDCAEDLISNGLLASNVVTIAFPVDREKWKPSGASILANPWFIEGNAEYLLDCLPENHRNLTKDLGSAGLYIHEQGPASNIAKALACAIPCVVDWEYSAWITDGWDGFVTHINNPDELRETLERASDTDLRARLAVPARTSSERWDTKNISNTWNRLLTLEWPKVSVVLPTYNRSHLIRKAVGNLLAQDYPNLEIIVVNDGSKDNTRKILDSFKDKCLKIINKENERLPKALNTGFEHASGELLTWTSDDNSFQDGALRALARELILHPEAVMVFSDYAIDEKTEVETGPPWLLRERNNVGASFMYRASAAVRAGQYDPELELAEDYDYWLRLHKVGPLIHLPRCLYNYGDAPDSLTRQMPVEVQMATLKLLEREREHDADWPAAREDMLKNIAMQLKEQGKSGESLQIARQLIASNAANMAGYKAALRALTPGMFLKAFRAVKGVK